MTTPQIHEDDLSEALHALAREVEERPVPWDELRGRAPRWRGPIAAAAAVALLAGVGAGVTWWGPTPAPDPASAPGKSGPIASVPAPRLVGHGSVAIEVPDGWSTNDTLCGTPQSNTVVIDSVDGCFGIVPRRAGVESITVEPFAMMFDLVGEPVRSERVLGEEATVWTPTCILPEDDPEAAEGPLCRARMWMHSEDSVMITAEAATIERAEELMSTLQRVPDRIGLLGPYDFVRSRGLPDEESDDHRVWVQQYAAHLRSLGLKVTVSPDPTLGREVAVSPGAGTLVRPGSEVSVTYRDAP